MLTNCKIVGVGVDSESYHQQEAKRGSKEFIMSPSSLKAFDLCAERWVLGYNAPESEAKDWGNAVDILALTPELAKSRLAVIPATYKAIVMECPTCHSQTDSAKCQKCKTDRVKVEVSKDWNFGAMACSDWRDEQGGRLVISNKVYEEAKSAVQRLRDDETISAFLDASDKQVHVSGEWHDEATGLIIPVQCLIDCVPRNDSEYQRMLGDLKTTRNASQKAFGKWCYQAAYHVQAGFDLAMYRAATGEERTEWGFLLSESFAPYQTGRRILRPDYSDPNRDETLLGIGRATFTRALKRYAQCLKTGTWTTYDEPETFTEIIAEPWHAMEESSKMAEMSYAEAIQETDENPDLIP